MTSIKTKLGSFIYRLRGQKPFSRGYTAYKQQVIEQILQENLFGVDRLPSGYGLRLDERVIEYPWLLSRLPVNAGKILDAGSVLNFEWLLNQPGLQNKRLFISTLAPEKACFWQRGISYVYEDLRSACYRDRYFDWVVCLSTLEHVGLDNTRLYTQDIFQPETYPDTYLIAIKELQRILKPGGRLYLSVPFGSYKNHGWLQIFDQTMVNRVIDAFVPAQWEAHYFQYQLEGWQTATSEACQNATYFDWYEHGGHDPDYAAAARAVVCLEMVK
ncbi:hypothetical protein C7271_07490 [filamentous cyanobacterium CCP5]|nr:hypothetical protein C7271_07490 [filamentous cyanobacterium CCP5]